MEGTTRGSEGRGVRVDRMTSSAKGREQALFILRVLVLFSSSCISLFFCGIDFVLRLWAVYDVVSRGGAMM